MENSKSSYRGTFSYIGGTRRDHDLILVAIASREFYARQNDPGLTKLRVTSGSKTKQVFLIVEEVVHATVPVQRIYAIFKHRASDYSMIIRLQDHLNAGTLTDEMILKEGPEYFCKK